MFNKTIIIGEYHEDPSARLFVRVNIQSLINKGISIFGFEHGENTNLDTEIQWLEEDLSSVNCMRMIKMYAFFNRDYKKMQSNHQLLALFKTIADYNIEYQGLDADIGNRWSPVATVEYLWDQLSKMAESDDFNTIINFRDNIIVGNLLKHSDKQGINIVGLLHLKGIQELLIKEIGEEAVRNNYEFIVIRGNVLTNEDIQDYAQAIPIPALIVNSDNPGKQFDELFKNVQKSTHLKMD